MQSWNNYASFSYCFFAVRCCPWFLYQVGGLVVASCGRFAVTRCCLLCLPGFPWLHFLLSGGGMLNTHSSFFLWLAVHSFFTLDFRTHLVSNLKDLSFSKLTFLLHFQGEYIVISMYVSDDLVSIIVNWNIRHPVTPFPSQHCCLVLMGSLITKSTLNFPPAENYVHGGKTSETDVHGGKTSETDVGGVFPECVLQDPSDLLQHRLAALHSGCPFEPRGAQCSVLLGEFSLLSG